MEKEHDFKWTVIGAGPAGIAAVGKLIDNQVNPKQIAWLDPSFQVGDFGTKWNKVPSNTKVSLFLKFLNESTSFNYPNCKENFKIHELDPNGTCELSYMVSPLAWISEHLRKSVTSLKNSAVSVKMKNRNWVVSLEGGEQITSTNVILATGAKQKSLSYPSLKEISLEIALNKDKLSEYCSNKDKIAVFGSSHSAVLILRNLIECTAVTRILNFYQSPLCYAVYLDDCILFDNTGLKGTTALWAKENLHGKLPQSLERYVANKENLQKYLSQCTHVIYAVGFESRAIPVEDFESINYNAKTGIIAPGLFGFGIAYPESKVDRFGIEEYRVGLWKFMSYLNEILPIWQKYSL
ncbi:FAD-dependent oxidoreductase [Silvanigrella aquatica]|uniref:Pyridine nucleotide-disulfide oxidoreductase n=1 Tax=Silvanigrella aquatica TaxID=1915309 RepID=A0A1L4D2I6_9BACT|nr:FAD-dependent oxidoreductase [Silvanigrella aquatica]APJ04406.1 pyridine nucleotide-disulfide oxidoreductase [Silvanigrella aquatica]